jgi:electron transfer flavoprotein beta subunit
MMKILVCIDIVPDTTARIEPSADSLTAELSQVQWVINPWDELALTRAVELREKHPEIFESITVIHAGSSTAEPAMRKALAIGADKAVRIDTAVKGPWQLAHQVADYIKSESFDLILAGIESSVDNASATGHITASLCDFPVISNVVSIKVDEKRLVLVQESSSGQETLEVEPPLVAVVQKGVAIEPRIPSMRGIMQARSKPFEVRKAIDCDPLEEIINLEKPPARAACKMIDPEDMDQLVKLLQNESKVL